MVHSKLNFGIGAINYSSTAKAILRYLGVINYKVCIKRTNINDLSFLLDKFVI